MYTGDSSCICRGTRRGSKTQTHTGGEGRGVGEEERLDGGGITSNYRTAKAEARQLVQKFMETWNIVRTL